MNLTPKGQRIGDKIREQLADPDSYMSKAVRDFRAMARLMKSNPRKYRIILGWNGIEYQEYMYRTWREVGSGSHLDIGCLIS